MFTPPSSRSQSVEPLPERRSCSRGVISEPLTGESSRRAASSGRQESPTSHSEEDLDRQSLQTISTDPGSQNSRSEYAPETNRSNNDRTSIDHPNSPEIRTRENSRRHFEEVKDSALSQKASAKENREKVSDKSKEELQGSHSSSPEETTPEDATLSAKYGVNDENAQDDRPSSLISHNEEPGSRPVEKSMLDVFNSLFVGFDALVRFNERENCCIASTKDGNRCTRLIRQIDVSKIRSLLTRLSAPYETERFNSELLPLVNLIICERSHRKDVRKLIKNSQHGASVDNETTVAATAACTVEKPKYKRRPEKSKAQATPQTPRYNLRSSPSFQAKPPSFTPWQPTHSQNLDVPAAVAKTMRSPIIGTKEKPGWLYVYWNPSNSGYYKIGYTTVGIATRLRKWEMQCRHRAEQVSLSLTQEGLPETKEVEKLPHALRLEALVHATLKEDRYCEPRCAVCYECHKEWFCVKDLDRIKRVIAFWSEWIRRGPYEFVEGEGKWTLKAEFEEEVKAIGQRLEELENGTHQSQAAI